MLRAIVGVLSLGLLVTLLASTVNSAPRGRAVRGAAGRGGNMAARAGTGAQNAVSGRVGDSVRQRAGAASNFAPGRPSGPISATGNIRPNVSSGLPSGSLNVPNQRPGASQWQGQLQGHLNNAQGTVHDQLGQMATAYGVHAGGAAPFSPAWYAQHPNAWQVTHPHAGEAFVAATALGLASFMAIESGTVSSTTVVYTGEATAEQTQTAAELAQAGEGTVDSDGQWMPIGAFAFRPTDAPNATRMIQLAVNPQGTLRGAHYDLLSEETADIIGAVDKNTSQVSWRIGESGQVIFESDLAQLTQHQGQVRVHYPDGQTGQWALTRLQQ